MSLSTLLEAAQYLDYLDSNQNGPKQMQAQPAAQHQHQQHPSHQSQQQQRRTQSPLQFNHQSQSVTQPTIAKKSGNRRQRSSRKDAANTMLAMSLPTSTNTMQMHHGVPIPLNPSNNHHNYHLPASLSSSLTTGSPLSSFASTALLCSKVSGVTSASSSAASSLSSSDSSSSCGEILMGDNDFNQTPPVSVANGKDAAGNQLSQSFSHQQTTANGQQTYKFGNDGNQSFAHYIAATSAGPQLVTMSTTSSANSISASAPLDGRIRAGHVIHAAANSAAATGTGFDPRQFSIATPTGSLQRNDQSSFGLGTSLGSDSYLSSSPGACASGQGPMVMARAYPIKFSSISPSAHQSIMAFQQQSVTASSPTSSSSSYSRHRELHKTLEKNRRAHLRHCFELLKSELPASDCVDKKTSHINIIKSAIRFVLALRQQECEMENELQRLTRIKNELTDKLSKARNEQQVNNQSSMPVDREANPSVATSVAVKIETQAQASTSESLAQNATKLSHQQQPASEQQLSFLLSQSKID